MDYGNDLFDPLKYDEKILSDHINMEYSNPRFNQNQTIVQPPPEARGNAYVKMLERESIVNQVKKEILADQMRNPRGMVTTQRDHASRTDNIQRFSGNYDDDKNEGSFDVFKDNRFLIFLVIVLTAICIIQWTTYNRQLETMNELMQALLIDKKTG